MGKTYAILNATILDGTAEMKAMANHGVIVGSEGRIEEVGPSERLRVEKGMNVIDILILATLAVSVIFGMYRGFISGVLSVAALIGAAAAAFAISPSLATWLQGNETLVNTLMYYTDAGSRIKDLDLSLLTVAQASQSAVAQIISGAQLPQQFQAAFINAVNTAPGATTMSTLLSQTIVNVSLSILSFLICFLGCYIVASFLIHLICYVFELPVLRHLDALMGGVFGLARGVLLLFIFFALVPIIQAVVPVQQLTDVFTASRLAPLFDSQIILSILGA